MSMWTTDKSVEGMCATEAFIARPPHQRASSRHRVLEHHRELAACAARAHIVPNGSAVAVAPDLVKHARDHVAVGKRARSGGGRVSRGRLISFEASRAAGKPPTAKCSAARRQEACPALCSPLASWPPPTTREPGT